MIVTARSVSRVAVSRVAYLGPPGTFTEQALLTQPDLAAAEHLLCRSIPEVLASTSDGLVDWGFTAIENSIEGTVNITLDTLIFELDLLIQREVVMDIQLHLLAHPGTSLEQVKRVISFPVATAQCRRYLGKHLSEVEEVVAGSTAAAVRDLAASGDTSAAAIGTALARELYGLDTIASDIEDHPENQTRFVAVSRRGVPTPTGYDKTSVVVFQRSDRSGSLMRILAEFESRSINLTKLESRPTKKALGDYCFLIDLEGHVADPRVADCLRSIREEHGEVKFLGSYPAAATPGSSAGSPPTYMDDAELSRIIHTIGQFRADPQQE
ncbi:prephenate dehydratase [Candidatus Poriferisocius sp.]|uniref:prephenate dehydratase n=1 Tax=Candidatus Poriferisocius sp. TaxID=3101276 RepID=UPI003B02AA9D